MAKDPELTPHPKEPNNPPAAHYGRFDRLHEAARPADAPKEKAPASEKR